MPKLIDHSERAAHIAEATWDVLLTDGIRDVSLRRVAAAAGLSVGSLRHSTPTRSALLANAVTHLDTVVRGRILTHATVPAPLDRAHTMCTHMLPLDAERRRELAVYLAFATHSPASAEVRDAFSALHAEMRTTCGRIVGMITAPAAPPPHADAALHALLDGLALQLSLDPDDADPQWALDLLAATLAQYARTDQDRAAHSS